jgi:Bacterial Ig domain
MSFNSLAILPLLLCFLGPSLVAAAMSGGSFTISSFLGTTCTTIPYGTTFSSTPHVFVTPDHRSGPSSGGHDPTYYWVRSRTTTEFQVCYREPDGYGTGHGDMSMSWIAVDTAPSSNYRLGTYTSTVSSSINCASKSYTSVTNARVLVSMYYNSASNSVYPVMQAEERTDTLVRTCAVWGSASASASTTITFAYLVMPAAEAPNTNSRVVSENWPSPNWTGTSCRSVSYTSLPSVPSAAIVTVNHYRNPSTHDLLHVWVEEVTASSIRVCMREWDRNGDGFAHDYQTTVDILVGSFNGGPTANPDYYIVNDLSDPPLLLTPVSNDTDPDNDALTVTITGTALYGSVAFSDFNLYTYTPDSDVCKVTEIITYDVSDGLESDSSTITIDVDVAPAVDAEADAIVYTADVNEADRTRYLMRLNYTSDYDVYVNVTFPNSTPEGHCDFTSADPDANSLWSIVPTNKGCLNQLQLDVSAADMLGKCGFTQDSNDRGDDRTHFVQTVSIFTARTRSDLQRQNYIATTETQFRVDVAVSNNVTATIDNLQVYGAPVELSLLGAAQVAVTDVTTGRDADGAYKYELTGDVVTSIQWPYRLELVSESLASVFNASSLTVDVDTYCDEGDSHPNNTNCQQTWSFSVVLNEADACITIDALNDHDMNFTFAVNCSDLFTGECAPSFSASPLAAMKVSTPDFCPSSSELSLEPTLTTFAYGDTSTPTSTAAPTSGGGSFFSTLSDAPPALFREENLFVYDATLFGEVHVGVQQNAATVATTTILRITTTPSALAPIDVYEYDPDSSIETKSDSSLVVVNSQDGSQQPGFGTGSTAYHQSRARFALPLNAQTVSDANSDDATTFSLSVFVQVTFSEASSSSTAPLSPVLDALHKSTSSKSRRDLIKLDANSAGTFNSESTSASAIASLSPDSIGLPGGSSITSTESSALISNGVALVVGGVAVVAVLAFVAKAVSRAPANNASSGGSKSNTTGVSASSVGTLPASSSNSSFEMSLQVTAQPVSQLELIQANYCVQNDATTGATGAAAL